MSKFRRITLHLRSTQRIALIVAITLGLLVGLVPSVALAAPTVAAVGKQVTSVNRSGTYYIVQPGDNLSRIARRFGTTVHAIVQANGIVNPNYVYVGQRLYIPSGGGGGYTPYPVDSRIYIVQAGDSLSKIARRFNTTVQAIAMANGITNTSYVFIGQRLIVPIGYAYPPSVYGFYYTVRAGDTLSQIAKRYGVNMYTLASINGISNLSRVYIGQRLFIP